MSCHCVSQCSVSWQLCLLLQVQALDCRSAGSQHMSVASLQAWVTECRELAVQAAAYVFVGVSLACDGGCDAHASCGTPCRAL